MESKTQFVIRVEGMANSFGLGEVVTPGVTLFRAGNYNMTADELDAAIKKTRARKVEKL
jgi:hypothetical protein